MRPSLAVFLVALLASLCVHLPVYEALGVLAEVFAKEQEAEPRPASIEFELAPLSETAEATEPEPEPTPDQAAKVRQEQPEQLAKPAAKPVKRQTQKPAPKAKPKPPEEVVVVPEPPKPVQPLEERPLAVTQKSDDPEVEAPENPRFIAEENRRVTEETIANARNMHRDDAEPTPSAPSEADSEDVGDAPEQEVADLQKLDGSEERTPNETEAEEKPKEASEASAGSREAMAVAPAPAQGATQASEAREATRAAGAPEQGGEEETLLVEDASGSFRIRKAPVGKGPDNEGGEQQPGAPSPDQGSRKGSRAQKGVDLRLSWSQFEQTFGAEELQAQRSAYLEQRRSRARGSNRQRSWRKFRAAIENFVPNVRPGNQTALNTAADPFANYLAVVHRRIHRTFAHGFLRSLPIAGGPFSDRTLMTDLEIIINGDGSLHKVGVLQTSGFLPFDFGAFDSVNKAAPFSPPPRKILSGDGRVYVHWAFYRNERQCGTFNARPYILPHPPGTPDPRRDSPLRDSIPGEPEDDQGPTGPIPPDAQFGRAPGALPEAGREPAGERASAALRSHVEHAAR